MRFGAHAAVLSGFLALSMGTVVAGEVPVVTPAFAQTSGLIGFAPSSGFADLVAKVQPAVVSVYVQSQSDAEDLADEASDSGDTAGDGSDQTISVANANRSAQPSTGSGFFISPDGAIVTANHVLEGGRAIHVVTSDGMIYPARVVGADPATDLAVIKVDEEGPFPYVNFADNPPRAGDWVIAVGSPFGLANTVTAGIVSALARDIGDSMYVDYIQIDAPINRGNSGGPSFDIHGDVIGVNAAILSPSGGSVGIAFDIPAQTVREVAAQIGETGHVTRGWIGVQAQDLTVSVAHSVGLSRLAGALVTQTVADGPAARAGVHVSDVITAVNGTAVRDARNLAQLVASIAPGTTASLDLLDEAGTRSLDVVVEVTADAAPPLTSAN